MKTLRTLMIGVALVAAASAAQAFQEQQGGVTAPAPTQEAAPPIAPSAGFETSDKAKPSDGTEVRIPGVGKIGVLPKMDFGLELLYGAAEPKPTDEVPLENPESEDMTVRGSLKQKF